MATYHDLQQQAEKLLADAQQRAKQLMSEAESMRVKERQDNLELVRTLIKEYGYSAKEVGISGAAAPAKGRASRSKSAKAEKTVKYRGPNGETWGGGRGRRPGWVQALQAQGKSIEDYRV